MPIPTSEQLERLLTATFGGPVRVVSVERMAPWSVLQCRLAPGGTAAPASVVAKWLREDANGFRIDPRQVCTEQAALEYLAEIGFGRAPRLIAADRSANLLLIEDLSPRSPLADQLRAKGADACAAELLDFATAMGELGAATAGQEAVFQARRNRYGPGDPLAGRALGLGPQWPKTKQLLAEMGREMSASVEAELAQVINALLHPGPFLVLTNGDPEPNNFLTDGQDGRLIDFEFAAYRHALMCARWIHVPGPAWITVDARRAADLESAYRRALAVGIPEAEDDRLFGLAMATAALAWPCDRLTRFSLLDGRPAGDTSRVQMVSTLETGVATARLHRSLPELAGWCERAAQWLRRRWPDTDVDLASYPAYTPR